MAVALAIPSMAAVIGTNTPALSLTADRLSEVPPRERAAWAAYIKRSEAQMKIDRAALAAELKPGETPPPPPVAGSGNMPLDRDPAWYGGPEARAIADTIVSFQTPAGGWSKNQNRTGPKRLPGQQYSNNAETMEQNTGNFDAPKDPFWTFVGTLDNGATTTEMRFLARVQQQLPGKDGDVYRTSILKGVNYLLAAQYPNGGWPQNYPIEGGYKDGVTFNDGAVTEAATALDDVAAGKPEFAFIPKTLRDKSRTASARAIEVILAAQIVVGGVKTGWPQQADALTLKPISARNYEMRSIASAESAEVLLFLMRQPNPSPRLKSAVHAGIAWFKSRAIYDHAFTMTPDGRKFIPKPGAGPIWSRNYDIETGKPIFGDRDKSIHDDVNNISLGRRNGYSWYASTPQRAITVYTEWGRKNP